MLQSQMPSSFSYKDSSSILCICSPIFIFLILNWMLWPSENSSFLSFVIPHHFCNLIKMCYFFPRHCHIFLSSWHLIWRWQTGRCTVLWQICKPRIDLCSTHSNMQAWYLATYHKSCFTSLLIDFVRAECNVEMDGGQFLTVSHSGW